MVAASLTALRVTRKEHRSVTAYEKTAPPRASTDWKCQAGQGADPCSFADGRYVNSRLTNESDESSFT
jgi:hypothetical protein